MYCTDTNVILSLSFKQRDIYLIRKNKYYVVTNNKNTDLNNVCFIEENEAKEEFNRRIETLKEIIYDTEVRI